MLLMTSLLINRTGSPVSQHGSRYGTGSRERNVVASLQPSHRNRLRVLNNINDNYCVKCVTGLKDCACVSGKISLNPSPVIAGSMDLTSKRETVNSHDCKLLCCKCSFCYRVVTKERRNSQLSELHRNKICQRCFLCRSIEFCKSCHKCPNCCSRSTCRGQIAPVCQKMGSPVGKSQGSNSTQRGLHPPLPVQTQLDQVTNCHKQLCQPPQKPPLVGGLVNKNAVELVETQKSLGFYNRLF